MAKAVYRQRRGIKEALILGGYSEAQARKGMQVLERSEPLRRAFEREIERKRKLLKILPSDDDLRVQIKAQLYENMLQGERKRGSNKAAELLGRHRDIGVFGPETQVNLKPPFVFTEEDNRMVNNIIEEMREVERKERLRDREYVRNLIAEVGEENARRALLGETNEESQT